jgi:anti-sigma B factor antagonist
MTVSERTVGAVTVLDIKDTLTFGEGANRLRDKVRSLLQQGQKFLLLNLSGLSYVDSAGLGELVTAFTTVTRQGGVLKLVGVTKRLTDLLVITKLITVFESFDSEAAAIASFSAPR